VQIEDDEEYDGALFRYSIDFCEKSYLRASKLLIENMPNESLTPTTWTEFYRGSLEDFIKKYKGKAQND